MMPSLQKHRHPWPLPGQKLQFHLTPLFNTRLLMTCLLNYSLSNPTRINSNQMHSKTTQRGKSVCSQNWGSQFSDLTQATWRGIMQTTNINIKSLLTLFSMPCRISCLETNKQRSLGTCTHSSRGQVVLMTDLLAHMWHEL